MIIERDLFHGLSDWKAKPRRKPLILQGARQTGKTWLMKTFGERCFSHTAYFNFDKNEELHQVFEGTKDISRLLGKLAFYTKCPIVPEQTLIIFDEIQECNKALNSLKYFCEDAPEYVVIAAGSLLGVSLSKGDSFPVGKVDFLRIYPLSFSKFLYKLVKPGARAREYEDALLWLEQAGLVHRIFACTKPFLPLKAYDDMTAFKIYLSDTGLLRRLAKLPPEIILSGSPLYSEFKGAAAENAVLQSLVTQFEVKPRYWTSEGTAEVDFVIQHNTEIIPIEVKAAQNVTGKSLNVFNEKYSPNTRLRYSLRNLKKDGNLINIPLFLADWTKKILILQQSILKT